MPKTFQNVCLWWYRMACVRIGYKINSCGMKFQFKMKTIFVLDNQLPNGQLLESQTKLLT